MAPLERGLATELGERYQTALASGIEEYQEELRALICALQDSPDPALPGWPRPEPFMPGIPWQPPTSRFWLFLTVDWKDRDEVWIQAGAIAGTLELSRFPSGIVRPGAASPVYDHLLAAAPWFRARHFELVLLDSGGDEYLVMPIRIDLLRQAFLVADRLGVPTRLL